ncbi:hypothetical protein [Vampirovibrio sp.]|uniref:hypothetical protein n=1 Tax=Vampirovibrio sp. TaxID=2717857 RepID=UPI003593A831
MSKSALGFTHQSNLKGSDPGRAFAVLNRLERFVRQGVASTSLIVKPKMELALSWMITLAKAKINVNLCHWVERVFSMACGKALDPILTKFNSAWPHGSRIMPEGQANLFLGFIFA